MSEEDIFLNDLWSIYFHDPFDNDWTLPSYKRLGNIASVKEYWMHQVSWKEHIHQGIFFLFREHIFPCWDDPNNINGGCLSIKVLKENMPMFWEDMCVKLLGETLLKKENEKDWQKICGISTSPKKHFCIIKIWLSDDSLNDKKYFDIIPMYYGDIIYKSNKESITNDKI